MSDDNQRVATTEHTINDSLAGLLRETRRAWRGPDVVNSEKSGMIKGSQAQPDILFIEPHAFPVVVETEVHPASTVKLDATSRLGEQVRATGRKILSSIAVRLPLRLRSKHGVSLRNELANANDIEMALFTGVSSSNFSRWPNSGWISSGISDLSILVQSASVPPEVVEETAAHLVGGVNEIAGLIAEISMDYPGAIQNISEDLRQEDGDQTRGMTATILVNAFVFHERLAGGPNKLSTIRSIEQLRGSIEGLTKSTILAEWRKILEADYWPIFNIARRILEVIPIARSQFLIEALVETSEKLLHSGLMRSHDLTGAVFQQLIADRKFLAAYYTTPASAALLVGLAISHDTLTTDEFWSNPDVITNFRIADFACGTGTLLSAVYHRVGQLHELVGGDAEAIHPRMMASALVGCDVLPAATHLTASMLSGVYPTTEYEQSSILTVAYGRQPDGTVSLGSLDLLDPQGAFESLSITAKAIEGMGEADAEIWRSLPHDSFDMVVMNPPFTRATGHEGDKIGTPNPMFAAFGSSAEEQKKMGDATKRLTKGTSAHGNAGEASIFLVLADRKLKPTGILALVMPLTLMSGDAWEKSRRLLARSYSDLILISIAGAGSKDMSFSADTGMGECLIVGQKNDLGSNRAVFVTLREEPSFPLLGARIAEEIHQLIKANGLRRLEDGPIGGTPLCFGDELIGNALDAPLPASGGWRLARIADLSLAQVAYQLVNNQQVWLPTMNTPESIEIPISTVGTIAEIGPYHADINGRTSKGGIRGPFDIIEIAPDRVPTYPVLWSHDAGRERTLLFPPDSEGVPRLGSSPDEQVVIARKLAAVWDSASHCHFNRDFQFNSQSTSMQFTTMRTIGGHAWPSIRLPSEDLEKALVVWSNTSLGMLLYWWHASKQQSGRGRIGISALKSLPILDVTSLKPNQLSNAVAIFDELSEQKLLPLNEIEWDVTRKILDDKFLREVIGLEGELMEESGAVDLLRMKMGREPSIRGTKKVSAP